MYSIKQIDLAPEKKKAKTVSQFSLSEDNNNAQISFLDLGKKKIMESSYNPLILLYDPQQKSRNLFNYLQDNVSLVRNVMILK